MISISGKQWSEYKIQQRFIDKISQDYDLSRILSKLVIERNFSDDEIFSINNYSYIGNIFKNNSDFYDASIIIENSCIKKEKILIFGDYDVDGTCSTALLVNFFKKINQPCNFYIPNRIKDGYGPNIQLLKKLLKQNYKLVIFVDCASNSIEEIDFLNKNKIKSIIIDHHKIQGKIPNSHSLINPLKNDKYNKYDYFCATSLTFFLIQNILLRKKINKSFNINDYLFFVTLATVADVMPMRHVNRNLCLLGIKNFSKKKIKYFNSILKYYKINRKLIFDDLSFLLCPILNSGGRLNNSQLAISLLTTENDNQIENISNKLINLNNNRKKIEKMYIDKIINKYENIENEVVFIYEPSLNEGIIGILAARLVDRFNKPAFVITQSNSNLKGSARSVLNFDLGNLLHDAKINNLIIKGGGHKMAGGFVLIKNNLNIFKSFINRHFNKKKNNNKFNYTSQQTLKSVNKLLQNEINKLSPFGNNNQNPIFFFKNLKIIKTNVINEKHVMVVLSDPNKKTIEGISFNSYNSSIGNMLLFFKKEINILANLKESFFNNKKKIQLIVLDIII